MQFGDILTTVNNRNMWSSSLKNWYHTAVKYLSSWKITKLDSWSFEDTDKSKTHFVYEIKPTAGTR